MINIDRSKPLAYAIFGIANGQHYIRAVKAIPQSDTTEEWKSDDHGLGEYWSGNEALVSVESSQHSVTEQDERELFEATMPKEHPRDRNMPDKSYNSPYLHVAWEVWQIARALKLASTAARPESLSYADAAQWARDNGLNVPPEWTRQASTAGSEQPYSAGARAMTGTVMPCGACVTNVYEAYSAGRKAAASEQQSEDVTTALKTLVDYCDQWARDVPQDGIDKARAALTNKG